jgi:hypothetical protein
MPDFRTVLIGSLEMAYQTLDFTVADLSEDELHLRIPDAQIGTPASIYLHVAWSDDIIVNHLLTGGETVYDSQGWGEKMPDAPVHRGPSTFEWAWGVKVPDLQALMAYAEAVRPTVTGYVAGLSDADLDRMVTFFGKEMPVSAVISMLIWNVANHTGELAALRGVAGKQGLPF